MATDTPAVRDFPHSTSVKETKDGGLIVQVAVVDQWADAWKSVIAELNTPKAICGYVAPVVAHRLAQLLPSENVTVDEVNAAVDKLRSIPDLLPSVRRVMEAIQASRSRYADANCTTFPTAASRLAYMEDWVANYEISDLLHDGAPFRPPLCLSPARRHGGGGARAGADVGTGAGAGSGDDGRDGAVPRPKSGDVRTRDAHRAAVAQADTCLAAVHFMRHIERGTVKHQEAERVPEEVPFKKFRVFFDSTAPAPNPAAVEGKFPKPESEQDPTVDGVLARRFVDPLDKHLRCPVRWLLDGYADTPTAPVFVGDMLGHFLVLKACRVSGMAGETEPRNILFVFNSGRSDYVAHEAAQLLYRLLLLRDTTNIEWKEPWQAPPSKATGKGKGQGSRSKRTSRRKK